MSLTRDRTSAIVPRLSPRQAQNLAAREYDLRVTVRELPSYIDQNFHLRDEAGAEYVLKISNSDEDSGFLEAQVSALDLLQARPGRIQTPRVIPCSTGESVTSEGNHSVWLLTFLPGRLLAHVSEQPDRLLHELGRGLGDLDRRLADFDHPAARRFHRWDLRHAPGAAALSDHITDHARREAVRSTLERFASTVLPDVERLPFQVIHNDANDYNLLVEGEGLEARVRGLLDFGDLLRTARACEPAIAMTYAMSTAADPLRAGAQVLAGYHESLALARSEIRAIPHLIEARLCVSVTMSSYRRGLDPGNAYLSASEAPVRRLFDWISVNPPSRWIGAFEDACASIHPIEEDASRQRATDET